MVTFHFSEVFTSWRLINLQQNGENLGLRKSVHILEVFIFGGLIVNEKFGISTLVYQ